MPQNPTFVRPAAAGRIYATDPHDLRPCLRVRWLAPQGGGGLRRRLRTVENLACSCTPWRPLHGETCHRMSFNQQRWWGLSWSLPGNHWFRRMLPCWLWIGFAQAETDSYSINQGACLVQTSKRRTHNGPSTSEHYREDLLLGPGGSSLSESWASSGGQTVDETPPAGRCHEKTPEGHGTGGPCAYHRPWRPEEGLGPPTEGDRGYGGWSCQGGHPSHTERCPRRRLTPWAMLFAWWLHNSMKSYSRDGLLLHLDPE